MKKFTFFVVFICLSAFVHAQSSQSLGLNTSYSFSNKYAEWITYKTPQIDLAYNHFFNDKHGIVTELGAHIVRYDWMTLSMSPAFVPVKNYSFNYSLHYVLKHNQFFIKSGLNTQFFNFLTVSGGVGEIPEYLKETECPILFQQKNINFNLEDIQVVPEFHFALGRDFDLGKINIRVSGFVERAFLNDNSPFFYRKPIDFGLSTGVFYQFGK